MNLNNIIQSLGTSVLPCAPRFAEVYTDALHSIPKIMRELNTSLSFLVADQTTWRAAGKSTAKIIKSHNMELKTLILHELHDQPVPDEKTIGSLLCALPENGDLIIGVGSGTISDLCKLLAAKTGKPCMIVLTAPCADRCACDTAYIKRGNRITLLPAISPVAIVADTSILRDAPGRMISSGAAKLLDIYAGLCDLKIARAGKEIENNSPDYCSIILSLIEQVLRAGDKIINRDTAAIDAMTACLLLWGMAGGSRGAYAHLNVGLFPRRDSAGGQNAGFAALIVLMGYEMLRTFHDCANTSSDALGPQAVHWKEIYAASDRFLSSEQAEKFLLANNALVHPAQLGLDEENVRDAVRYAAQEQGHWALFDILKMQHRIADFQAHIVRHFFDEQNVFALHVQQKARALIDRIQCFVLDMDGTIYLGESLFPFTKRFLKTAKISGRDSFFFTNNSSKNASFYVNKLRRMGIEIESTRMMISSEVLIEFIKRKHPGKTAYVVGTPYLTDNIRQAGILLDDVSPDMVILGFDTTLHYEKLQNACRFIRSGCLYFGVNPDLNCPVENGGFIPDCGSMARLIEASTGRTPEFFGKPSHRTLSYIIQKTGYPAEKIAVIGDRLYTDIAVTQNSAASSILVLTGESTMNQALEGTIHPDLIVPSLESLIALL